MSNDLSEPLTGSLNAGGSGDDGASQSSQRSSTSLLERIRAQRAQQQGGNTSTTPTSIQVPQYNPVAPEENFAGGGPHSSPAADQNSFFSSAWHNISESMETGMASLQQEVNFSQDDQALLAPSAHHHDENYSMGEYFMTFVNDVYGTFLGLPLLVRVTMIFALLYTALKLM